MDRVKVGIIGAGGLAMGIHLPALAAIPEAALCAVCDWTPGRAEEASGRFRIPHAYLSYQDMLEKEALDAVFVLTQPDMLFRPAMDCLAAGLHVFMEKPMGITLFQAGALRAEAERRRRLLHVGFNRRYIPLVVEMVRRLRELTAVTHVEGRFYKNSSASFYDGCADAFVCDVIHVVDLVRHLAGGKPQKAAMLEVASQERGVAKAWYAPLLFDNGVSGLVRANYETGGRVHQFELHGPGASAYIDLGFADAGCSGTILTTNGGTYSLSAAGAPKAGVEAFDGAAIAGSEKYERYYGYYDEDLLFIREAAAGSEGDIARMREDYDTMELIQNLLDVRIGGNIC